MKKRKKSFYQKRKKSQQSEFVDENRKNRNKRKNAKNAKIVLSKTQKRNKRKNRFFKKTQSYLYYPSTKVLKQRKEIQYIYSKSAYSTKVLQIFNL